VWKWPTSRPPLLPRPPHQCCDKNLGCARRRLLIENCQPLFNFRDAIYRLAIDAECIPSRDGVRIIGLLDLLSRQSRKPGRACTATDQYSHTIIAVGIDTGGMSLHPFQYSGSNRSMQPGRVVDQIMQDIMHRVVRPGVL